MNKQKLIRYYRIARIFYKRRANVIQLLIFLLVMGLIFASFISCFVDTEKDKEMRKPNVEYFYGIGSKN